MIKLRGYALHFMSILCLLNVCALPVAFMLYKQKIADTENAALNAGLNTIECMRLHVSNIT